RALAHLQREPGRGGGIEQRQQALERDRPVTVVLVLRIAGPYQPDLRLAIRSDALAPARRDRRVGREIGNRSGYVLERRCAGERQGEQRRVQVERRQDVAFGQHLDVAAERVSHEAPQRPLYLQQHARAARRHDRRVAHELDGVAGSLLVVQQDCSSRRRLALPQGLREAARRLLLAAPAPFVLVPTFGVASHRQQQERAVPVGIDGVRVEARRLVVARERVIEPALIVQRDAEVVVRVGETRLERYGTSVQRLRLGGTVELDQRCTEIVVGVGE